jgi:cytochrome c-type biogenesis protein CcmE
MNKKLLLVGGVLIVAFAGFSLASFKTALTPYVDYPTARGTDRVVQIAGGLAKDSARYDDQKHQLIFGLKDEATGDELKVRYEGVKPGNFEDAVSIVAIGRFDSADGVFAADKLLVKCPSKYQGEGVEEKVYE